MRTTYHTLSRGVVHQKTQDILQWALQIQDYGRCCPARLLLSLLVLAASRLTSLFQACATMARACCYETARKALLANLPDEDELNRRLNVALAAVLPRSLSRRRQRLAIDLHLSPYHGQPQSQENELVRGKSRSGTTHFHAYATLYVVRHGQRSTIALTAVRAHEALSDILKRLLRRGRKLGIQPALLLLDRGFWTVDVIRYLQAARCPFLMPVIARGRPAEHPCGPSATREFFTWKKNGFSTYTLRNQKGRRATVSICVCRFQEKGRPRTLVYAFWGFQARSAEWIRETYRRRYGIESSYRQINQSRLRTCTRSFLVRLMRIGLSLVLRNVWVWLHYELLSTPHRGARKINPDRMYYQEFLDWLMTAIESLFGTVDSKPIERPCPQALTPLPGTG